MVTSRGRWLQLHQTKSRISVLSVFARRPTTPKIPEQTRINQPNQNYGTTEQLDHRPSPRRRPGRPLVVGGGPVRLKAARAAAQ